MVWDPFCPYHLYCALENGEIVCIDIRTPLVPLCTFQAHDKTTSSISFSHGVPGLFASCSVDKTVKLWDVGSIQRTPPGVQGKKNTSGVAVEGLEPHLVMYKSMNVGKLFALQYYTDDPFVLATAGDKGSVAVWECDEAETVKTYFQDRAVKTADGVYTTLAGLSSKESKGSVSTESTDIRTNSGSSGSINGIHSYTGDGVSAALELPGHKQSVVVPEVDDSWMDEPEPMKIEKKKKVKKVKK